MSLVFADRVAGTILLLEAGPSDLVIVDYMYNGRLNHETGIKNETLGWAKWASAHLLS